MSAVSTVSTVSPVSDPSNVLLRPMRWWDIAQVATLEHQVFPRDAWSVEQFWEELAQPTRWYVVAEEPSGAIVGYAGLFLLQPEADVQTIAVALSAQGLGLGRQLLGALIDESVRQGCRHVTLEVRSGNAAALRLYAAAGFTQISRRSRYYPDGEDACILRLDIASSNLSAGTVEQVR